MIDYSQHFDAIYCLSLADNIKRRSVMHFELQRVGIIDSGIFHWKITVRNELYKYIWNNPEFKCDDWWKHLTGCLNCTLAHYEIMKESLARGFRRVLIVEDDIRFLKVLGEMEKIVEAMPAADIVLFDKNMPCSKERFHEAVKSNRVNDHYIDFSNVCLNSAGCLALSTKAMETITESQEKYFRPADYWTNRVNHEGDVINDDGLTRVASIKNLAVQDMRMKEKILPIDRYIYQELADLSEYNL